MKQNKDNLDKNITILLSKKDYDRLKKISSQIGIPVSALCRTLIIKQLDNAEKSNDFISFLDI